MSPHGEGPILVEGGGGNEPGGGTGMAGGGGGAAAAAAAAAATALAAAAAAATWASVCASVTAGSCMVFMAVRMASTAAASNTPRSDQKFNILFNRLST
jgi:hypothetical protein